MFKRIKTLILSTFMLFNLASCSNFTNATTYKFKDITNHEISDINQILINEGYMFSSQFLFEGDYEKILDVDYMLSNMKYNDVKKIAEKYRYWLDINFTSNNDDADFYAYENKLYYFNNDFLYESKETIDYNDFKTKDNNLNSNNNSSSKEEVQTINTFVMIDYGVHISGKVTTLLNGNFIWFNLSDYGIDSLVAGDELVIKYTGEYEVQETYPGSVNADKMHIQSIEVIEADIVEFTVSLVPGSNEIDLVPVDSKYNNYILSNKGYVVSQDESFKKYDQYPENTILYASLPKTTGSIRVDGLYDYNPRDEIIPTDQYEVSIIDSGNDIIDELSNDAGMYTPGTKLEFYSHPIMDVDLAMYVDDEFYKIQDTIEIDGEYMWKYTFVMPAKDVVIEFYMVQYMPVNN